MGSMWGYCGAGHRDGDGPAAGLFSPDCPKRHTAFRWAALVVGHSLFNAVTAALSDIPEDRMYRYEYALGAALQFAVLLAGVLLIARPGRVRDIFALRRPSSWSQAVAIGAVVAAGTVLVLVLLDPLVNIGEAQRQAAAWDPHRAVAFAANALVVVLVGPVVEECAFRGLGYRLLERFGDGNAILLTGALFALSHGLVGFLPATAVFGIGLGYLRSRTGSLYPGLVLHVLFNTLGVLGSVRA